MSRIKYLISKKGDPTPSSLYYYQKKAAIKEVEKRNKNSNVEFEISEVIDTDFDPLKHLEKGFFAHPELPIYINSSDASALGGREELLKIFNGPNINVKCNTGYNGNYQRNLLNLYKETFNEGFNGTIEVTGGDYPGLIYNVENGKIV